MARSGVVTTTACRIVADLQRSLEFYRHFGQKLERA